MLCAPQTPASRSHRTQPGLGLGYLSAGLNRDYIEFSLAGWTGSAIADAGYRPAGQHTFGETEPGCQLKVVPRGAHGGGDGGIVQADFQWLFGSQVIGCAVGGAGWGAVGLAAGSIASLVASIAVLLAASFKMFDQQFPAACLGHTTA